MKIYVGHSRDFDYMNELYLPIINSNVNAKAEFIFPHLSDKTFNSKEIIENADLFIAEISIPSLGLGIEIGRAEMQNKKILCIYKETVQIPSSIKYVNVELLSYSDKNDMIEKIDKYINENLINYVR